MQKKLLYQAAIAAYTKEVQIEQSIEECGELIVALKHFNKKKANRKSVITEIADVTIMCQQLAIIFGKADVLAEMTMKRERQAQRLLNQKHITQEQYESIMAE